MTVNGVSTDTTGRLPWAGALAFPVGDPLPAYGGVDSDVLFRPPTTPTTDSVPAMPLYLYREPAT